MAEEATIPFDPQLLAETAEELYEDAPCGYLSTLPDGRIVKVNQTFLAWTGYERADLLAGRRIQSLLAAGGRILYETHLAPLLRMQGFIRQVSLDVVCADGRKLPVLMDTVQRRGPDGQPLLNRTTLVDITERKSYERELLLARRRAEQAAEAKAAFLSMMSHEIRTPLNAIVGVAFLLEKSAPTPTQQRYIRLLQSSSQSLLGLINDILDFSKIEAGKVALEERPLDLRRLAGGVASALAVKAEEKGVAMRLDVAPDVPEAVVGDGVKIGQILTNLTGNAVKFTEQGSVTVSIQLRERLQGAALLTFSVADTGIGIAPDQLPHVFEEFTQASADIGVKYGGTGLGLAITRRLLELHGSQIEVRSEPGRGSTFSFDLQLRLGEQPAAAAAASEERSLAGARILVAEDNPVNVFVLTRFLAQWGARFDVAEDGRQAVERALAEPYDVILLDLQMPEMDGYDAAVAIRAGLPPERRDLPILAVSASTRLGEGERLRVSGFDDFISKPFDPSDLFAALVRHLKRRDP